MCGIAGIYGLNDATVATEAVHRMNSCIAHRGPDDEGFFSDERIAFGHRRLAIIDLSPAGHQPMKSSDGNLEIIFNGEIYNFNEARQLITGYDFKTRTDTEVILAAYTYFGKNCLQYLNGMFAFAIWDKNRKELFIARDRLGIKPLYYYRHGNALLFASEIRALLASGMVPRKINHDALSDYFTYQTVHAPATIVKDVLCLMPGHHLTVGEKSFEIEEYWSLNGNRSNEAETQSYQEVCSRVKDLLTASVKRRLVSDVPFGAFLSGGIDSSAVVGLMSQVHTKTVKTFNISFDESKFSEAIYARAVAKRFNTEHHEFVLKPADFLVQLPGALRAMDHPSGDGPNSYVVSKITRENGITMALSGLGGDEVFAGYPIFNRSLRLDDQKWIFSLPTPVRKSLGSILNKLRPGAASSKIKQVLSLEDGEIQNTFPIARRVSHANELKKMLDIKKFPHDAVTAIVNSELGKGKNHLPLLSKVSIAEITTYMQNVLLRDTDQMSMAVALEVRVPFLDFELVEYVLGIPDKYKKPVYPKKLLVESLGDLLPPEIVHRKKMGFVFPWEVWLKNEMQSFCSEKIMSLSKRNFIHRDYLVSRWNQFIKNDPEVRWTDIWICVVLENWLIENAIES